MTITNNLRETMNKIKHFFYFLKHGFWPVETWDIHTNLCRWLLPRLKQYRIECNGYPVCNDLQGNLMTYEVWKYYVGLMIYWCEAVSEAGGGPVTEDDADMDKFELGKTCFATYIENLWW